MTVQDNMNQIEIIVAVDKQGGFSKDGKMPWHFAEDFKHFQDTTKNHACVMGRATYEEIAQIAEDRGINIEQSVLPQRDCYVVSTDKNYEAKGATTVTSLRDAVRKIDTSDGTKIFVIGGKRLFEEAMTWAQIVHMTVVQDDYHCDKFFPVQFLDKNFEIQDGEENEDGQLAFLTYKRENKQ